MKPRTRIRPMSEKRLKAAGGKLYSTIRPSSKKVRSARKPRKPSEKLRIYGPPGFVEWIHTLPCVACGVVGYSECAHVGRFSGMGRKGSWRETVPLCGPHFRVTDFSGSMLVVGCHRSLHQDGQAYFASIYHLDLTSEAERIRKLWLSYTSNKERAGK